MQHRHNERTAHHAKPRAGPTGRRGARRADTGGQIAPQFAVRMCLAAAAITLRLFFCHRIEPLRPNGFLYAADDIPAGGVTAMLKKIAKKERTVRIALRKCDMNHIGRGKAITYRVVIELKKKRLQL